MTRVSLKLARNVNSATEVASVYTPPAGSTVYIQFFSAEGVYTSNSACKLIWKFNHPTEQEDILWLISGSGKMPQDLIIPATDTDGVRKLAVTCDNGELTRVALAAWAEIIVRGGGA